MKSLNPKQERFCKEYLIDFNATQAAIRAGYSKQTAKQIGSKLLTLIDVQHYLNSRKDKLTSKLEISQERTLNEIARLAFSDVRKTINEKDEIKFIEELDDDTAAAVSSVEFNDDGSVKRIKFHDKPKAIEMLAKHFHIYQDISPTVVVNNQIDLSKLSADELLALLNLKKKVGA